jgi:hypothetical protein
MVRIIMRKFLFDMKNQEICQKSISKPIFTFITVFIITLLYSLGFSMVKSNAESTCINSNNSILSNSPKTVVEVETQKDNMQIATNSKEYATLLSSKQISSSKFDNDLKSKSSSEISESKSIQNLVSSKYNHKIKMDKTISISSKNKLIIKKQYHKYLPEYFNYTEINKNKLRAYLNKRNSLLADEPYFSTIIATSKSFNLNPLILFAITGQEQSFVPKSSKNAYKIANNPFNIFHSWKDYNTDIADASRIVSRTIIHLSEGRPSNTDPFKWINRKYANDPSWGKGVRTIYKKLVQVTT